MGITTIALVLEIGAVSLIVAIAVGTAIAITTHQPKDQHDHNS